MVECIVFFTVLRPDFSTKLILPVEFGKGLLPDNAERERDGKEAVLVNPTSGREWSVRVYREGNEVYFGGEKWHDFTVANRLRVKYILEFRYRGSMLFTFRVLDGKGSELTSPPPVSDSKQLPVETVVEQIMNPYHTAKGKEKVETRGRCGPIKENQHKFKIIMKSNKRLHVPAKFRDNIGLSADKTELNILDPKGRLWDIGCFHRNRVSTGHEYRETTFTRGWSKFASQNELKVGDKCIFELVTKDEDGLITIRMLPNC